MWEGLQWILLQSESPSIAHNQNWGEGVSKSQPCKNEAFIKEQEVAERASKRGSVNPFPKGSSSSMAPPSSQPNVDHAPRKRTKEIWQLEKMMDVGRREDVDSHVARCIYACGISFNVGRSPYWQDMVRAINDGPKGYKTPSFEKEKYLVEQSIKPIRSSWQTTGVLIISDGWTDARNRPLINVIVVCLKGSMFLNAVDCNGELKDATFIVSILIDAIESVGPSNVVQVITDNARACKAARLLVEARYGNIFWTPCAVHSLNLILKKIGKIEWIKKITNEAKEIEMFITNHHMAQAIYQQFASLELVKVAETQFAIHFIKLRRLLEVKSSLCNMVISDVWDIWRLSNTDRAQDLKRTVLDDIWWGRVRYLLNFCEPIVSMICLTNTDTPCLEEVYEGMDSMLEKIREVIRLEEKDESETFYNDIQDIIVKRWNKMTTPLHTLAYALTLDSTMRTFFLF
eukprot:Gb_18470 [translate_table: standard]